MAGVAVYPRGTLGNTRSGLAATRFLVADEMAAFDQLPEPVREAMRGSICKVAALEALGMLERGESVAWVVAKIASTEARELAAFAGQFLDRHRRPLSHLAAGASPQRPGPPVPARRRVLGEPRR